MKVDTLMAITADAAGVTITDMTSPNRRRDVVVAKELFCYYAREGLKMKHSAIAYKLNMDRASVYHTLKRFEDDVKCYDAKTWEASSRVIDSVLTKYKD